MNARATVDASLEGAAGAVLGLLALWVDSESGGHGSMDKLVTSHGRLPETLTSRTTQGSVQMVFTMPIGTKLQESLGPNYPGMRIVSDYDSIVTEFKGESVEIADAPAWLLALASGRETLPSTEASNTAQQSIPGTVSLLDRALALLEKGLHVFPLGGYGEKPSP